MNEEELLDAVSLIFPHYNDRTAEIFGDAFDAAVEFFVFARTASDADRRLTVVGKVVPDAVSIVERFAAHTLRRAFVGDLRVHLLLDIPGRFRQTGIALGRSFWRSFTDRHIVLACLSC